GRDGRLDFSLIVLDDPRDLVRRLGGALGEALHLLRDDGEGLSVAPRARRLDRRVEREELRLVGDLLDDARYGADLLAAPAQRFDGAGRDADRSHDLVHAGEGVANDAPAFVRLGAGTLGDLRRFRDAARAPRHRLRHLLRRAGDEERLTDLLLRAAREVMRVRLDL